MAQPSVVFFFFLTLEYATLLEETLNIVWYLGFLLGSVVCKITPQPSILISLSSVLLLDMGFPHSSVGNAADPGLIPGPMQRRSSREDLLEKGQALQYCYLLLCSSPVNRSTIDTQILVYKQRFFSVQVFDLGGLAWLVKNPFGLAGKESACNAGDLGSIPELGRSPKEGKGYPLQHSGLENSMSFIVHGVAKNQAQLSHFHFFFFLQIPCPPLF